MMSQEDSNSKMCGKCGKVKEINLFYRNYKRPNAYRSECKICSCLRDKIYFEKNKKNVLIRIAKSYFENHEENKIKKRNNYHKNRKKYIKAGQELLKKYRETVKGRERFSAYHKIWYELKHKRIVKKPCELCGEKKSFAHHYSGYNNENKLKVRWLCIKHHSIEHTKYKFLLK